MHLLCATHALAPLDALNAQTPTLSLGSETVYGRARCSPMLGAFIT